MLDVKNVLAVDDIILGKLRVAEKINETRFIVYHMHLKRLCHMTLYPLHEDLSLHLNISHQQFPVVLELVKDDKYQYLLRNHFEGETIREGIYSQAYTTRNKLKWIHSLLSGIGFLHHKGIIHGNINVDNCIINRDQTIHFLESDSLFEDRDSGIYDPNSVAPERLLGIFSTKSDLYSIGLMIKHILPGKYRRIVKNLLAINPDDRMDSVEQILLLMKD